MIFLFVLHRLWRFCAPGYFNTFSCDCSAANVSFIYGRNFRCATKCPYIVKLAQCRVLNKCDIYYITRRFMFVRLNIQGWECRLLSINWSRRGKSWPAPACLRRVFARGGLLDVGAQPWSNLVPMTRTSVKHGKVHLVQ